MNVLRERLNYPDLKKAVCAQAKAFDANVILIEDKASGTQLIQDLRSDGVYGITAYDPEGDKVMRMHSQTGTIESGFVYLPRKTHWLAEYLHELTTFPNGKYDDQVDSTSQALDWIAQALRVPSLLTHYKRIRDLKRSDQSDETKRRRVRLIAAPNVNCVFTRSGERFMVDADGTIELSEYDALPLIRSGWKKMD